jgi:hypothetical protein
MVIVLYRDIVDAAYELKQYTRSTFLGKPESNTLIQEGCHVEDPETRIEQEEIREKFFT